MRILIYAPAARMGGARAHVLGLVPELASMAPDDDVLLIAQPDLLDELPPVPPTWTFRAERAPLPGIKSQLKQLVWEQRVLPRIARRWRADVLLSFGSFVPLRPPCPTVLEAGNALPFTRAYWQVLSRESLLVQLEAQARWTLLQASLRAARRVLTPTRAMRVDVVTRVERVGPKSVTLAQRIVRADGIVAADGSSVLVAWDPQARGSRSLTDDERSALAA